MFWLSPPGAFYFLSTYFVIPFAICEGYYSRKYVVSTVLAVWWIPMLYSAIKDWRDYHFGYESFFSKIWFWVGLPATILVDYIITKLH